MKRNPLPRLLSAAILIACGVIQFSLTRTAVAAGNATSRETVLFAVGLLLILAGALWAIAVLLPRRSATPVRNLTMAAVFASLCYIGFTFFRIDIPVGMEKTAFHLGNVFCVLAALFLGGFWGGMAGAVGMTIADLTTAYVTSAPKTFVLKLCIGLVTGFVAHKLFHLTKEGERKIPLSVATVLSCAAGMAFNMIADPVVGYFYKLYVLGVPQEAATIWAKIGAVTTSVNAVVAVIAASIFYLALCPALKRANLMPQI